MAKPGEQIRARLKRAAKEIKKANRKAVSAGGQVFVKGVRATVPQRTGLLRKAIAKKIWIQRDGNGYTAVIGADRGVTAPNPNSKKYPIYRPANIVHLVEYGFRSRNGRWISGSGAIRKAYDAGLEGAKTKYIDKLSSELDKALVKGAV